MWMRGECLVYVDDDDDVRIVWDGICVTLSVWFVPFEITRLAVHERGMHRCDEGHPEAMTNGRIRPE